MREVNIPKTHEFYMLIMWEEQCPYCNNEVYCLWHDNDGGMWDCEECSIRFVISY